MASMCTTVTRLITCEPFIIERVRMVEGFEQAVPGGGLAVWIVLEGRGELASPNQPKALSFRRGDTVVFPASSGELRLKCRENCMWLEVTVPQRSDLAAFERADLGELPSPPENLVQINPANPQAPPK